MKNKYTKIVLLVGLLVGSKVFAINTINTNVIVDNAIKMDEVKAFYRIKNLSNKNYIKIISTKSGATGNGDTLKYEVIRRSESCKKSTYPSLTIVCDDLAITSQLIDTINTRFVEEGFSAEKEQGVDGNSYLYIELGMLGTRRRWVLSGGVDAQEVATQVVSFTPTVADARKHYTININSVEYSITVNANTTIKEIVEAFQVKTNDNSSVTCTEDDTKLTCTANTAGESFTHTISVADRINESNAEKDARLAEQAWQSQLTVTTSSLTTANTAQANATTAMNDNDSLPSKSAAIEASKQANAILLIEIHKLNELKKTDANVITVNDFNQQYRTLNTATNTLITNYTEQNLEEIWKNQLTVVTSSLTTANNKRINATTSINSSNSLSSKLISIEMLKLANTALFAEIQTLEMHRRTNADGSTVDNFNQKHQALNTVTNMLMASYEEQKRIANDATAVEEAILTGHWKSPIIKGLTYATATRSGVTDESGAFKCQSGEIVDFSIESLALTSVSCAAILGTKTTNSVALANTSSGNFKDWQNEPGRQIAITKVLFGLFGESVKRAFSQEDENLRIITVDLTEAQKANTVGESLEVNDLNLLVQNILGTTKTVTLPTTKQADNMIISGWQASKVFDGAGNGGDTNTSENKKSSGGGCVYNPNAPARFDMGFILLMVLSAYYLIRRKRRFV
ncbi:hypothetical protein [uncultured Gammaproteobacteria bacterium]|jgi:hypothetical protein|nr:hypothetical protein [uncultured Gammaproteobacteria bacterium]CAC9590304.1 hypothetical protein [uncultured Gammaproteobacteria bacterium]CAC9954086.1 hypothetical protein [uncultured Gammaproteobacteria bacterium]